MEKNTLVKWVNCLTICPPCKTVKDLSDGGHFIELCNFINPTPYPVPDKRFEKCLEERYVFIKETFDYYFDIDGKQLFDYDLCKAGSESNTAKLAIMLMYAFMNRAVPSRSEQPITELFVHLYELEVDAQQSIKACLGALLSTNDETTELAKTLTSLTSLMDIETVEVSPSIKKKTKRKRTSLTTKWSPLRTFIESSDLQQQLCGKNIKICEKLSQLEKQKLEKEKENLMVRIQNDAKIIEDLKAQFKSSQSIENQEHSQMEIVEHAPLLERRIIMSDSYSQVESDIDDSSIVEDEKGKTEVAELKSNFEKEKKKWEDKNSSLNIKVNNLKFQETMYRKECERAKLELEQMKNNQLSSKNDIEEEKQAMDMVNKKILEDLKKKFEEDIKKLKEEKAKETHALKKENGKKILELQDELKITKDQKHGLENDLNQITDRYGTSLNQVDLVEKINEDLKLQVEDLSKKYSESTSLCDQQEIEVKNLRQQIETQHQDFDKEEVCEMEIEESHAQEETEVIVPHEMQSKETQTLIENEFITDLEQKAADFQIKINELKLKESLQEIAVETLQSDVIEGNEKISSFETQLASCHQDIDQLKSDNELLSSNLHQETAKTMQLECNMAELTDQLKNSESVRENVERENQQLIESQVDSFSHNKVVNDLKCKEKELVELQQVIRQLKSKIINIKNEGEKKYDELKSELEFTGTKYKELRKNYDTKEQEVLRLKTELKYRQNKMKSDDQELTNLKETELILRNKLSSVKNGIKILKRKFDEKEGVIHKLKQDLSDSEETHNRLIGEKLQQDKIIEELQGAFDEKCKMFQEQAAQIESDREEERKLLRIEQNKIGKRNEELIEKNKALDEQLVLLQNNTLEEKISLQAENEDLRNAHINIEKDRLQLENRLIEKNKALDEQLVLLQNSTLEEKKSLQAENEDLRNAHLNIEKERFELENRLIERNKTLEEQFVILQNSTLEEKKLLQTEIENLQKAKLNVEKEHLELEKQLINESKILEGQLEILRNQMAEEKITLQVENENLKNATINLERERSELENQFINERKILKEKLETLRNQMAEEKIALQVENENLKNATINIERECSELENQFVEKFKVLENDLAKQKIDQDKENELWQTKNDHLQESNLELNKDHNALLNRHSNLIEDYEALKKDFAELKCQVEAKERKIQAESIAFKQLMNLQHVKDHKLQELIEEKTKQGEELEFLRKENVALLENFLPKFKRIARIRGRKIQILEKKFTKHSEASEKRMKIWKKNLYDKFSEKYRGKFDYLVGEIQRLAEFSSKLQSELDERNDKEKALKKNLTTIKENSKQEMKLFTLEKNQQITDLEKRNHRLQMDIKSLEAKIDKLHKEVHALTEECDQYKDEVEKLHDFKNNMEADVPEQKLKQDNEYLKMHFQRANKTIRELYDETAYLKQRKAAVEEQLTFYERNNNVDALSQLQCKLQKLEKEKGEDLEKIEKCLKCNKELTTRCTGFREQLEMARMKMSLKNGKSYEGAYLLQKNLRERAAKPKCPASVTNHPLMKPNDDFSFIELGKPIPKSISEENKKKGRVSPSKYEGGIQELIMQDRYERFQKLTKEQQQALKEKAAKFQNPFDENIKIPTMKELMPTYYLDDFFSKRRLKQVLEDLEKKVELPCKKPRLSFDDL